MMTEQPGGEICEPAVALPPSPLAELVRSFSSGSVEERLEQLLIGDQELLISLHCQLDQIRRELRLLNDDRILRALGPERDSTLRH